MINRKTKVEESSVYVIKNWKTQLLLPCERLISILLAFQISYLSMLLTVVRFP